MDWSRSGFFVVLMGLFIIVPIAFAFYGTQLARFLSFAEVTMIIFAISVLFGFITYFAIHVGR